MKYPPAPSRAYVTRHADLETDLKQPRMARRQLRLLGVTLVFLALPAWETSAQSVRATGITTLQYVELRPLVEDSVSASQATGEGLLRYGPDGRLVRCADSAGFCRFTRSGGVVSTVPAVQDISVSVWGLGQGIRGYAHVCGRRVVSGEVDLWPRANDEHDVLVAYGEIDRGLIRVRAGRQWKVSGLGYYNYDGGSALIRKDGFSLEAYGGWSLARGLNEPRTSGALAAIESFATDDRAHLFSTQLSYRPRAGTTVTALYQREIRSDRAGLHSERAALDAVVRRGWATVEGSVEVDLAVRTVNEALLRGWVTPWPALGVGVYGRRYRPFFELWTIWGAFNPVGFDEYGTSVMWSAGRRSTVQMRAARRHYGETDASFTFGPVRTNGWNVAISGSTLVGGHWQIQGGFRTDIGVGAAKDNGHLRVQRQFSERADVGINLQAFQRIYEFRVDQGTVIGVGADGSVRLGPHARVSGSLTRYSHTVGDDSIDVDPSLPTYVRHGARKELE